MRILMVNKFYPPDIGGVETIVAQYAQAAKSAGHDVEVLACHSQRGLPTQTKEYADGIRVTRCYSLGTVWSMPIAPAFLLRYLAMYRAFDLVHFHEPFPLGTLAAICTLTKKYVITWHSDIVRQRLVKPFVQSLQWLACRSATLITTTSPALARSSAVLRRFAGKVRVIPLSVGHPATMAPQPQLIAQPYCLFLGRLTHYKGLTTLVSCVKDVRFGGAKLVIAGTGPLQGWVKAELSPDTNVILLDRHVSESEKHALLQHCLFLVFPSTDRNEAFGIVQLEAMSYGKAVINTNLPTGVPWVSIHGETGLTVEPGDAAAMTSAIQMLLDDAHMREVLGAAATQRVADQFADSMVLPLVLAVYESKSATLS
jgi:glycosyltransferase involved in cell wall biosynthesis